MKLEITLANATDADIPTIQTIYSHHVLHGIATFEVEPPSVAQMRKRYHDVLTNGLPYLVAAYHGEVVGYCYLSPYRPRFAYRFTLEDSVYIHADMQNKGVGSLLMNEAISRAEKEGYRQIIAVIGNSQNIASLRLHASLGFKSVGPLTSVGFKHGQWVDTVMMQRALGEGNDSLPVDRL